jgi:HSP20 family molecular chaperone IbpA
MERVFREMDRLSPFSLREWNPLGQRLWRTIPIETTRDGQRLYKIELDLPDFEPKDINVTIKDRNVTVKAKKETESEGCKQYREYSYQYTLPNEVNVEHVRSLLTNEGLLTIEAPLPQLKEPQAQEIPIQRQIKEDDKK